MGEPAEVPINAAGADPANNKKPSAASRLRDKAKALRGPRGKYRCRKCHEMPCVCPDPKQSEAAETPAPARPPVTLFNETNSKRLLEVGFGIPTVITQCKLWALTEDEALELSKPTADVLNEFVAVDPKWVGLSLLAVSLGSIMARKSVQYAAWKHSMAIANQRAAQTHATAPPAHNGEPAAPPETNGADKTPGPSTSMDMLQ